MTRSVDVNASEIDPRTCDHPNLMGMNGHCVWCGIDVTWGPRLVYSAPHVSDEQKVQS